MLGTMVTAMFITAGILVLNRFLKPKTQRLEREIRSMKA